MTGKVGGLYAITPDGLDDELLLEKVGAALDGGARLVQYRNKRADARTRLRQARALAGLCHRYGVPLVINDHVELATEVGANGVHVGRDDGDIAEARSKLGPDALIGASCYNQLEMARAAQRAGASYVAFGSFFPSGVKPDAVQAPLQLLAQARQELNLPLVAIGGIDHANAPQLIAAGAHSIAVISALFSADDIRAAAARLSKLFP